MNKIKIYKFLQNPFLWGAILGVFSLHIIKELANYHRSAPPPLLYIKDWHLIDQNNKKFGSAQLKNKVVIVNLFFTRCPSICPKLINTMKKLYKCFNKIENQIHFISITIDPLYDSPTILKKYIITNNIIDKNWTFLTGKKSKIYDIVITKMKLHIGKKQFINNKKNQYDIDHFGQLILLDQNGNLRGIFSTEYHILAALERSVKLLIEKGA